MNILLLLYIINNVIAGVIRASRKDGVSFGMFIALIVDIFAFPFIATYNLLKQ